MDESIETVVIGAGQAGLSLSYHLGVRGLEHVVLERARVAERWRSQRWDSLTFQFPNWSIGLPGKSYAGPDPEGFSSAAEVTAFIEQYARWINAPLRTGVEVHALRASKRGHYLVSTSAGQIEARNVVIATGPYQTPRVPALAAKFPRHIVQVHAADYRNTRQLPPGGVLVVGSGASGCQIAEELLVSGRDVLFAIGRHRRVPRRYRGRDVFWWRRALGLLDVTAADTPEDRRLPPPLVTGVGGGHDVDIRAYARDGMTLLGRLRDVADRRIALADDLETSLAGGDRALAEFTSAVDEHLLRHEGSGIAPARPAPGIASQSPREIDTRASNITTVVWATGYRCDFQWIRLPIFDLRGHPIHHRGVTSIRGILFLGLAWLHKAKSSFLCGVGEDAEYLVEVICSSRTKRSRSHGQGIQV